MQEIAENVYYEINHPGVVLGAVNTSHGLLMIDSPIYGDDARSWRSALMNYGSTGNRLLISLDAHHDRSLGLRNLECRLVGHEDLSNAYRSRPVSIKAQEQDAGAEWETYGGLGSIRWLVPEITFSERMLLHWTEKPIRFEYHPGPSIGASWVVIPEAGVVFIGDAVVSNQPPFLAEANIEKWIESLKKLLSPDYQNYVFVSGRSGLVTGHEVQEQIQWLEKINSQLKKMDRKQQKASDTGSLVEKFMQDFNDREMYSDRLKHGLYRYFEKHYSYPKP
ncbi:MAG: hypothetical protein K8R40_09570 [Anaerolineaceae bacterium]|nr:hypothetical protein [Anaerolineaceae bacterium]